MNRTYLDKMRGQSHPSLFLSRPRPSPAHPSWTTDTIVPPSSARKVIVTVVGPSGSSESCQSRTRDDGGTHSRTSAHNCCRPSGDSSTSRPSSKAACASKPYPLQSSMGHHKWMPAVNPSKANSGCTGTHAVAVRAPGPATCPVVEAVLAAWEKISFIPPDYRRANADGQGSASRRYCCQSMMVCALVGCVGC